MTVRSFLYNRLSLPWVRFFRNRTGRARDSHWVALRSHRVFILPTRAGLAYSVLLMILLLGAINYNNNLVFGLTFLLAGLALVAMLHTYRNLAHLQLQAGQGEPGFVGEQVGFRVWLKPADGRTRYAIELKLDKDINRVHVEPSGTGVWLYRRGEQRGRLQLGLVTIGTCFPLGLFYAWSRVAFEHHERVYPAPAPVGLALPNRAAGQAQSGDQGAGHEDFRGFRAYHPGDSLRHVYWKALAREQGLLTKEFGSAQAQECWLDLAATPGNDVEMRLQQLCRWVLEAERAQLRYGLRLGSRQWPPARGNAHRDRCLTGLAEYPAQYSAEYPA